MLRDHVYGGTQILGNGAGTYHARDELFDRMDIGLSIAVSDLLSFRDVHRHLKRHFHSADTVPEHKFGSMYLPLASPLSRLSFNFFSRTNRPSHDGLIIRVSIIYALVIDSCLTLCYSYRTALGTPVGGALYARFGIRAPFMFAICCTIIDLAGRFLVVERKEAALWGIYPAADLKEGQLETAVESKAEQTATPAEEGEADGRAVLDRGNGDVAPHQEDALTEHVECIIPTEPLSLLSVVCKLCKSPRALVAMAAILTRGYVLVQASHSCNFTYRLKFAASTKTVVKQS